MASYPIETKYYYWAVKLLSYGTESDIVFGFVRKDIDPINVNGLILENRSFLGLMPGTGRTFSNRQSKNRGWDPCPHGTELGLLFK